MKNPLKTIAFTIITGIMLMTLFLVVALPSGEDTKHVDALVIDKHHKPKGASRHDYEEFKVTVRYNELERTFDSEKMYYSHEEGDTVRLLLVTTYDASGAILYRDLRIDIGQYEEGY